MALELVLLRLKQAQPPTLTPSTTDTGTSAAAAATKKKRHVDWPQDFSPGMSSNVEYDKLDLAEFVAGYLSMIKTYDPEATKFMLSHLELLMIKGTSCSWSSVRSFHAHIAKQVELYRLEWSDTAEIRDRANNFFKHSDLHTAPTSRVTATPPSTTGSKQDPGFKQGITPVLALAKRTKTPLLLNTSVVFALRTTLCSTALRDETPIPSTF